MTQSPESLCKKLGLKFNDSSLIKTALTHRSVGAKNNERLEYLGDSILGFVIAECLFEKFSDADEGVLSRLRSGLVNQGSLAEIAREHDLGEFLILGCGERKSGGFRRDSILSDALEAIMGAMVVDQGIPACKRWILGLFADRIDALSLSNWEKDPKTRLQELMQSKGLHLPSYKLIATDGKAHAQKFTVECEVDIVSMPEIGMGTSRKKAEQQAAEKILNALP